jgi:hypothetical protein
MHTAQQQNAPIDLVNILSSGKGRPLNEAVFDPAGAGKSMSVAAWSG